MSELIVIGFDSEEKAEEVREKLLSLQKTHIVRLEDAAIATRRQDGRVKLNQLTNPTAAGALGGGFWGILIGAIFLMPHIGLVVGAASGALAGALTDVGVDDDFMTELGQMLQPGSAALFVLMRKVTEDKLFEELQGAGGRVIRTSLDNDKEEQLRAALAATARNEAAAAPSDAAAG